MCCGMTQPVGLEATRPYADAILATCTRYGHNALSHHPVSVACYHVTEAGALVQNSSQPVRNYLEESYSCHHSHVHARTHTQHRLKYVFAAIPADSRQPDAVSASSGHLCGSVAKSIHRAARPAKELASGCNAAPPAAAAVGSAHGVCAAAASSRCGDEICTRQPAECGHGGDGKPPCCEVQPPPMASRRAAAAAQARLSFLRRRCRGGQASRVTSRLLCAPGACRARETGCAVKTAICSLSGRPAGQRPEPASERRKSSTLRPASPVERPADERT